MLAYTIKRLLISPACRGFLRHSLSEGIRNYFLKTAFLTLNHSGVQTEASPNR